MSYTYEIFASNEEATYRFYAETLDEAQLLFDMAKTYGLFTYASMDLLYTDRQNQREWYGEANEADG